MAEKRRPGRPISKTSLLKAHEKIEMLSKDFNDLKQKHTKLREDYDELAHTFYDYYTNEVPPDFNLIQCRNLLRALGKFIDERCVLNDSQTPNPILEIKIDE